MYVWTGRCDALGVTGSGSSSLACSSRFEFLLFERFDSLPTDERAVPRVFAARNVMIFFSFSSRNCWDQSQNRNGRRQRAAPSQICWVANEGLAQRVIRKRVKRAS